MIASLHFSRLQNNNYSVFISIVLSLFLLINIYLYKSTNLYIIFVIMFVIIYTINRPNRISQMFINSLILFSTLRLIFFASTHFKILPFIDTYWDLAVVRTFIDSERIFSISDYKGGISPLEGYSRWPLLHIYEYIGVHITGIDPIILHMTNLLFIGSLPLLTIYIIIRLIYMRLNLPKEFVYIALIVSATLPDMIYWSLQLIRNTFAWVYVILIIFLLLKYYKKPPHASFLSILLLSISAVLSHHWSSSMLLLLVGGAYLIVRYKPKISSKSLSLTFILIISVVLLVWLLYYANILFEMVNFSRVVSRVSTVDIVERFAPRFPPELTPPLLIAILRIKTLLTYAPIIAGGYLLYRFTKSSNKEYVIVVFFLYTSGIILAAFNLIINLEPTRVIMLLIPLFITSLSIFYTSLYSRYRYSIYILVPFVVTTSFIGIFSHSIVPLHLYTNIVNPLDVGEHSNNLYFSNYFSKIDLAATNSIFSDDTEVLAMLLDTSQLHKIEKLSQQSLNKEFFYYHRDRIIVITKDFLVYRYGGGGLSYISYDDSLQFKDVFKQEIKGTNLIYNDSYSTIYQ